MQVLDWLYANHEFFVELRAELDRVIARRSHSTLDEIVVGSRRPVRTALLMLHRLLNEGRVRAHDGAIVSVPSNGAVPTANTFAPASPRLAIDPALAGRYVRLVSHREAPALLWSQRRLTPESGLARAAYVASWARDARGTAVFLGDDDMVSPLVAALLPNWSVHVVDIDSTVLAVAADAARALGARLNTYHTDLSSGDALGVAESDVVVSDPFPSGDGSFEALFWLKASRLLRRGGFSISTISPSHKPVGFDAQALEKQCRLGLALRDVAADFGQYEVFDFEFTALEREWLRALNQLPSISQTKSLMTAQKIAEPDEVLAVEIERFDFANWSSATVSHYLTQQAGVEEQLSIAATRGTSALATEASPAAATAERPAAAAPEERMAAVRTLLHNAEGGGAALAEADAMERDAPSSPEFAELGLCARAVESWTRYRLDQ